MRTDPPPPFLAVELLSGIGPSLWRCHTNEEPSGLYRQYREECHEATLPPLTLARSLLWQMVFLWRTHLHPTLLHSVERQRHTRRQAAGRWPKLCRVGQCRRKKGHEWSESLLRWVVEKKGENSLIGHLLRHRPFLECSPSPSPPRHPLSTNPTYHRLLWLSVG